MPLTRRQISRWNNATPIERQTTLAHLDPTQQDGPNLAGTVFEGLSPSQLAQVGTHNVHYPDLPVNPDTTSPVASVKATYDNNPVLYSALLLGVVLVMGLKLKYG